MSILLSAYFPEGIVFAADKNATLLYSTPGCMNQDVDVEVGAATKVIPWARRRAVVGYCGLGRLAGLTMEEWMRQFAAQTRDFDDLAIIATQMRELIQRDFDQDYPEGVNIDNAGLIVHFGGFRYENGTPVPAMYLISNVPGFDEGGKYKRAVRNFRGPSDEVHKTWAVEGGVKHPSDYKPLVEQIYRDGGLLWFNNGLYFPAFNVLKGTLWAALTTIRNSGIIPLPSTPSLEDRVAYCKMSVELFDSFFRHHAPPRYRFVGGGADAEWVPWPEE